MDISSYGIGAGLLFREGDIILHTKLLFVTSNDRGNLRFEKFTMLGRYSEVYVNILIGILCIECSLNKMLLKRSTYGSILIEMEEQQALGQLAKVKAFGVE